MRACVCVYLWRCRRRRMMLSVHCSTPRSYRSNCKSRKGEGGQERRGEEGRMLERLEQIECRSGEQWEGETNRIEGSWDTESNDGVFAALQGCFLSLYLFWGVKVTQGHNVQASVYLSSISDLSPLSLCLHCLCLCVYVMRESVYKPLCALAYVYLCMSACVF